MKIATFKFIFDSIYEANIIAKSINPEIKNKIPKTDVDLKLNKNIFLLKIISKDTSSLRAAINSYLRWIDTALKVNKIV